MKTFFFKKPPILYSYEISCTCVITYPYLSKLLYIFFSDYSADVKKSSLFLFLFTWKKSWKKTSPIKRKMSSHLYQNFILWKQLKIDFFPFLILENKNCRYKAKKKIFFKLKNKNITKPPWKNTFYWILYLHQIL